MKKLTVKLIFFLCPLMILAQPADEYYQNAQQMVRLVEDKNLYLSCQRSLSGYKEKLHLYSVKGKLMPTYTLFSGRTSWTAQGEVIGIRMQGQLRENTHLKVRIYQKGNDKGRDLHLQMQLPTDDVGQLIGRKKFQALEKSYLDQPMLCRFKRN